MGMEGAYPGDYHLRSCPGPHRHLGVDLEMGRHTTPEKASQLEEELADGSEISWGEKGTTPRAGNGEQLCPKYEKCLGNQKGTQ